MPEESIAKQFLESAEFLNRGDQFFIDFLYPERVGPHVRCQWRGVLAQFPGEPSVNSRPGQFLPRFLVFDGIVDTPGDRLLFDLPQPRIGRWRQGFQFWIGQLHSGLPFASIAEQFLASDEFFASGGSR